jgi:hypothetical protein
MLLDVLLTLAKGIDLVFGSSSSLLGGKLDVGLSVTRKKLRRIRR